MNARSSEKGQVLILIILAIVGIFGFAALAVDGGRVYSERRRAQSAADSAAYAAAMAAAHDEDWEAAALKQAALNGFHDTDPRENPGQAVDVIVNNPPNDGPYSCNCEDEYYQVLIRSNVDQVFSQFVYNGALGVEVEAVSHAEESDNIAGNNAVHATKPNGEAIKFHGNADITVDGGDIYGTGFIDTDGNASTLKVTHGGVISHSTITLRNATYDYSRPNRPMQTLPKVPEPDCSGLPARSFNKNDNPINLQPGIYSQQLTVNGNGKMNLAPGMYCLDDGIKFNGGEITGHGVFLVIRGGSVRLAGQTVVRLTRPNSLLDASGNQWGGMLMYVPSSNSEEIHLSGGAGATYAGTIFAPGTNVCELEGNGGLTLKGNVICYYVEIGGTSGLNVYYVQEQNYQLYSMLELSE